jgi:hypothetical protein
LFCLLLISNKEKVVIPLLVDPVGVSTEEMKDGEQDEDYRQDNLT